MKIGPLTISLVIAALAAAAPRAAHAAQRTQPRVGQAGVVPAPTSLPTAQVRPRLIVPAQVIVMAPAGGQSIPLDGKVLQIPFSVKNLDPNKQYGFMPELLRHGAALGPVFGTGFVVNPHQDPLVVGVKAGHYLANYADQLAAPGAGYQYRITVYEGTWGKGHKVAASGLSGAFSFQPAP